MRVTTIDEYLQGVAPAHRAALETLREQIRAAAPNAEECISYGQPAFRQGRVVCGFGAASKHCALYMFSGTIVEAFADELSAYDTSKGTVRLKPGDSIPDELVRRLVEARLAECAAQDDAVARRR